ALGAVSAGTGEMAAGVNPWDQFDPIARLAGGLAGGYGAALGGAALRQQFGSGAAPGLARALLSGINPQEMQLGEQQLGQMRQAGYSPVLSQGFEGNPRMEFVSRVLAETGRNTPRVLSGQARQGLSGFERLRQGLQGTPRDPNAVANATQRT